MTSCTPTPGCGRSTYSDELIGANLDFAKSLSRRLAMRLPGHVDVEELEADAYYGLLRAARSFDPTRGVAFRTYAARRIHGQMLDGLRERNQIRRNRPVPNVTSLDLLVGFEDGRPMALGDQVAADQPPAGRAMELLDEAEPVLRMLNGQSRQYLEDFHLHGKTQHQIAQELGVSQSAVSQRFKRIGLHVKRLRRNRERRVG